MIDVGVASPRAHGHAMISTATVFSRARLNAGSGPNTSHARNVTPAIARTIGTNQPVTLSARRWIGAFEPWASCTSRTIWARTVSRPTLVASNLKLPDVLRVPPMTSSPGDFVTGIGSPVTMLSSTAERPSRTTPSTGTFSPGRTVTRSPRRTSSMRMSTSAPARSTRAVRG
jgi:hypothetical protein